MAIVFISPQKKQRVFLWMIIISLILFLMVVSYITLAPEFLNKNQNIPAEVFYNKPYLTINLSIVDSDQVKNLEPFGNLETTFTYVIQDQNNKQIAGNISAATQDDAKKALESAGFIVVSIQEMTVGRSNPFVIY